MPNVIVVGAQWGDEGKGKVVDLYAQSADVIVRFNGGNNAGHTIIIGGEKTILHHLPSGILHPDKLCLIGNGVVIDPEVILKEIDELKAKGRLSDDAQLKISEQAHIIMPYHRRVDLAREQAKGTKKIGTTGRGIGPCYEDKASRCGIRFGDLLREAVFREKLAENVESKNLYLTRVLGAEAINFDEIFQAYLGFAKRLSCYAANVARLIEEQIHQDRSILFEGAQGALLDLDHGTYPYVTSSSVAAGAASTGAGIGPKAIDDVIGVTKAYTTRVGGGPFPTEQENDLGRLLGQRGMEFGSTTGRPRRCGWWDGVAFMHSRRVNGLTGIAVTKLDVLTGIEPLKICTSYKFHGELIDEFPLNLVDLQECEPVYEEIAGWQEPLTGARRLRDLPKQARYYLERIEETADVPIVFIGVGAERSEAIISRKVF